MKSYPYEKGGRGRQNKCSHAEGDTQEVLGSFHAVA